MMEVNYVSVLLSAVAAMVIGSVWYGPLFGRVFMNAMGIDKLTKKEQEEMQKAMLATYAAQFVASLVMFYVLAYAMATLGLMTLAGGMTVAVWVWVGFILPVKLADALWGGKMIVFWLGAGNMLLTLLAAGAIVGMMG